MKNVYFIENKIQCDYSEFSYVIEKKKKKSSGKNKILSITPLRFYLLDLITLSNNMTICSLYVLKVKHVSNQPIYPYI